MVKWSYCDCTARVKPVKCGHYCIAWMMGTFCSQHPNISHRNVAALSHAQAEGANPEAINKYFKILGKKLWVSIICYTNLEEYLVWMRHGCHSTQKVSKLLLQESLPLGVNHSCISAAGFAIPPMVAWDHKYCTLTWPWVRYKALSMVRRPTGGWIRNCLITGQHDNV